MQFASRASLAFKFKKIATKPAFGANVINAISLLVPDMKNCKTVFPDMPVSLSDLRSINNELCGAISEASKGNQMLLRTAILQWDAAFTLTADYISNRAKGDEDFIRNTGFVPTKKEKRTILMHNSKHSLVQMSNYA